MYSGIIYCAISPSNKKYYGKTVRPFKRRIYDHLKNSEVSICHFSTAIRKYGINNFSWNIIETIEAESKIELRIKLNEREIYWIKKEQVEDRKIGYNMTPGGDGGAVFGRCLAEKTKKLISDSVKKQWDSQKIEREKKRLENIKQQEEKKENRLLKKLIKLSHIEEEKEYKRQNPKYDKGLSKNSCQKRTEKEKEHLRIINTGKKQSKQTVEKRLKTMGDPWNKGKKTGPLSEKHKENMRKSHRIKG